MAELPPSSRTRSHSQHKRKLMPGEALEAPWFFKEHQPTKKYPKLVSESKMDPTNQPQVIIVGGGIAGMCAAMALADQGRRVLIIEELDDLGLCATGKSAGHLAVNANKNPTFKWGDILELGGHFHAELSSKFDGETTYGFTDCDVYTDHNERKGTGDFFDIQHSKMPVWLNKRKHPFKQVNSRLFVGILRAFIKSCELIEVRLNKHVEKLILVDRPGAKADCIGIEVVTPGSKSDPEQINGTVVIANGCWTNKLFENTGKYIDERTRKDLNMGGIIGTGLVWQLGADSNLHSRALLFGAEDKNQAGSDIYRSQEMYLRRSEHGVGQELYGCIYISEESYLVDDHPEESPERNPEKEAIFLPKVAEWTGITRPPDDVRTCYMPYTDKISPIVGPIGCVENLFVIAGLSCWGMTMAPAAGYIVSRFLAGETLKEVKRGLGRFHVKLGDYVNHDVKPDQSYAK